MGFRGPWPSLPAELSLLKRLGSAWRLALQPLGPVSEKPGLLEMTKLVSTLPCVQWRGEGRGLPKMAVTFLEAVPLRQPRALPARPARPWPGPAF